MYNLECGFVEFELHGTPYLSHPFWQQDLCRHICHFCFSQTKQRINFTLCRTTKHSNYYVGKNFQIFSCILNAKKYFFNQENSHFVYLCRSKKSESFFTHWSCKVCLIWKVWSPYVISFERNKKEKFACCKLVEEYGSQSSVEWL